MKELYFYKFTPEPELIDYFLSNSEIKSYNSGHVIYANDIITEGIYMILHGVVECYYLDYGKKISISLMSQGSVLGATSFINKTNHAYIRARTLCTVAFIPSSKITSNPAILRALIKSQIEKMHMYNRRLVSITNTNSTVRLLLFLIEAGYSTMWIYRDDMPVCIYFTRKEIANYINCSREHVSSTLRDLSNHCRIVVGKNYLIYYPYEIQSYYNKIIL